MYAVNWVKAMIWVMVSVALFFIVATRLHCTWAVWRLSAILPYPCKCLSEPWCALVFSDTLDVILAVFLAMVTWGSYHRIAYDVRMGQQV